MSNCREEQGDGGRNSSVNRSEKRHDKTNKLNVALSKSLSRVLRHNAQKEGLNLQADGYVRVDELMRLPKFRGTSFEKIELVVKENDKQRFTLLKKIENGKPVWWIRANQGHTIEVKELELERMTDPSQIPQVVHGTYFKNWDSIKSQGLSKMNRNHIHLAIGRWGDTDVISGMRKNCSLFIYVNIHKAMNDGIEFYKSSNGVILTEGCNGILDKKYFLKVIDKNEKILYPEENPIGNNNKNVNGNNNRNVDNKSNNKDANGCNNNVVVGDSNKNFVGINKNVNNKIAVRSNGDINVRNNSQYNYDLNFPAIGSNNQNVTRNNNIGINNQNVTGNNNNNQNLPGNNICNNQNIPRNNICNSNWNVTGDNIGNNNQNNTNGTSDNKKRNLTMPREPDAINNVPENSILYKKKDEEDYFTGKKKKNKKRGKM